MKCKIHVMQNKWDAILMYWDMNQNYLKNALMDAKFLDEIINKCIICLDE